jgi:hypothetical protein
MENTKLEDECKNLPEESQQFLRSLDDKQIKSYFIAKSHLGDSFTLEKSRVFIEWVSNKK